MGRRKTSSTAVKPVVTPLTEAGAIPTYKGKSLKNWCQRVTEFDGL